MRDGFLGALSCTSRTTCAAVGARTDETGAAVPLAEKRVGGKWHTQAIPRPAGAVFSRLAGLSRRFCAAVGSYRKAQTSHLLSELWNGRRWRSWLPPSPPHSRAPGLAGVSRTSATACTAAGSYFGNPLTLAERWNGAGWRIQATVNPIPLGRNEFQAVACASAGACLAVGTDAESDFFPPESLAENWDGTAWRLAAARVPVGTFASSLFGVSCQPRGSSCTAVGFYQGISGVLVTLVLARR